MFNKKDFTVIVLIVLIFLSFAGFSFYKRLQNKENLVAIIKQDNKIVKEVYLNNISEENTITLKGDFEIKIQYKPGRIRFLESGCKDQECVNAGWLTSENDAAVCLPNRISIHIISAKNYTHQQ